MATTRRSLRAFFISFALLALPLGVLAGVGAVVALRQLAHSREMAAAQTFGAVTTLVAETGSGLRREAALLARDPALIEGAAKGDWATLARFASPRILAVTRDGFADLVVVRDPSGAPLVQVPAIPAPVVPSFTALTDPVMTLRLVNGHPLFLAAAPIWSSGGRDEASRVPVGMIVVGRRFERLGRLLDAVSTRPGVVFLMGDRALASTRPGAPASGWSKAVGAGHVVIGSEVFALRPLTLVATESPDGSLWALLPEMQQSAVQWRLWTWLAALFAVGGATLGVGIWAITRGPGARDLSAARMAEESASRPRMLDGGSRPLEALSEIAAVITRGADLVSIAGETLDVVRRVSGIDVGIIYRLDRASATLALVGQRGLDEEQLAPGRVRPLEGTDVGEAARSGRAQVTRLDASSSPDEWMRDLAGRRGYRVQLALPISVREEVWGVMALLSREVREWSPEELAALDVVARQVGLAVERAENARLFAEARRSAAEYQALFEVAGLVGSTLDVDRLLDLIVDRCRALMGVASAGIFRLDPDTRVLAYERGVGLSSAFVTALRVRVGEGTSGRAVLDRTPVWSADIVEDPGVALTPETRALVANEGYRAVLSVPILSKGEPHGVLAAYWWEPHVPSASEVALMSAFAGQAGIALENARLFSEERRREAYLAALLEVNKKIGALAAAEPLLQSIAEEAARLLDVDNAGFRLLEGDELVVAGLAGTASKTMLRPRIKAWESLSGKVVSGGRALVCDIASSPNVIPEHLEADRRLGYTTFMGVPLRVGERTIGVLTFRARRQFTPGDQEVAEAFAGQAAIVIENARLYAALDVRANRLRTLARLTNMVSSSLDVNAVLQAIARAAAEIMGASFVSVYVADEAAGTLELRAASDERMGGDLPRKKRGFGEGLVGWVAAHRQPLKVADVLADERAVATEWARTHGLRSFIGVPIIFQNSLLGVLTLNDPAALHLGADDERLLESFVSQAAVAIRNTRLYAETAQHLEETRALLEVVEILNSTLDPRRLLKQVAVKIAQVCRVDRCSIERWDGDQIVPLMSQFADGRRDERLWTAFLTTPGYAPREIAAYALAIETRRPVVIADASATDLFPREWVDTFAHKSVMVVPLIRQDAVIGVLILDYVDRVTPFEPWQADLAMAIAGQLALSIENARLYGEAQERLRETTTLLAVAQVLSQPGPAVEVMQRVAREVAHAFSADMVGVYLLDARKELLVPAAGYRVPNHVLDVFTTRPFQLARFPMVQETWRAGRAFWSADVKNDPRIDRDTFEALDPHAVLFAATMVRGEAVGALFLVWWGAGREFQPAEIRLIEGVASQLGLAMENAELARQTQQKLEETESLLSVSRTLASTLDLDTLPRQFLRHVVRALSADTAGMWLLDGGGEWMEPLAGYHVPADRLDALRRVRLSIAQHPFYAEAARSRRPVLSTDVMHDPRIPQEMRDAAPHRTQLFVPIIAKDRIVGGFGVTWWEARREPSEGELRLMEAIASQAGVALENARLFRDNQRRVEELSVLHELSRAVTGQLDQSELLDTIEQRLARLFDVRHIVILLHDEATDDLEVVLRVRDGVRVEREPERYRRRAAGLSGIVLETARPIRTEDYIGECERRDVDPIGESIDLPHWLGVPMAAGNRTLGVLALRNRDRAFTDGDQRLLASIADLAALALRSARLYEERTRAHSELAAAQDQLVRTEKLRAMGEMASGVAHDFNNVLAAVLGRAQLLLGQVQDPKLRQWIQVIERSALDGARTVRRLQEFTRIRRDHPVVPVDLNQVVQQTLEATESTWRQASRSRGIQVEVVTSLAVPLPEISGDPAELREALTNLILNALDAMPGGGKLTLGTSAAYGHVQIAVTDTGVGIPAAIRHKIFDPFFTTKGPKGTGLGLSMTYGILARHGARITVESEEGKGATFHLIFPAVGEAAALPGLPETPAAPAPPLRCLVVDDEEPVAAVLGDMLVSTGNSVEVVGSGPEAIARFGAEAFDLVLTDLAMPGMTGWEVARAIKNAAPAARVVLVSGFGVEVSPEDLRAHGVDLVLTKPLTLQDIEAAVALARSARVP